MRRAVVEARVPGDKSITHRALIFGALGDGRSELSGLLDAADTRSTAAALRALGVPVADGSLDRRAIPGVGLQGLQDPLGVLDCGNSGTTARLLLGLMAGAGVTARLDGDASLRRRPMGRVTDPLTAVGAAFDELGERGRLPIRVRGGRSLTAIDADNPRSSAQVKTALLLAGLTAGVPVRVREPGRSRDHTERMLRAMGAPLTSRREGDGTVVDLEPCEALAPLRMRVPGDFSSAAFFLALGALRGPVSVAGVGLNPTRTGALRVLERMGAAVSVEPDTEQGGEPVGRVTVGPGTLEGTLVTPLEVPTLLDEIPVLAAVAARATGETRFEGIAELRVKESDRVQAVGENLAGLGVEHEETRDTLTVKGTRRRLAGVVRSFGDHRIAMAFAVLGAVPGNEVRVEGMEDVAISFPGFVRELERVRRTLEEQ